MENIQFCDRLSLLDNNFSLAEVEIFCKICDKGCYSHDIWDGHRG